MSGAVTQAGVLPQPNWSMWTRPLNPTKPHPATDLGHAGMWRVEDDKFICYTGAERREVPVREIPDGLVRLLPDMPITVTGTKSSKPDTAGKEFTKQWAVRNEAGLVLTKDSEKEARDFRREFDGWDLLVRAVGEWEVTR